MRFAMPTSSTAALLAFHWCLLQGASGASSFLEAEGALSSAGFSTLERFFNAYSDLWEPVRASRQDDSNHALPSDARADSLRETVQRDVLGKQVNMTLFGPEGRCTTDSQSYIVPLSQCYSPPRLFPGDQQWGAGDVIDKCNKTHLTRTFYASENGSCQQSTSNFTVALSTCVGPFGKPRPWGSFAVTKP
ncbi:unnamed protein product [Polarella glacialis]|uniref:Uncharacterized protein n=1 Tax=Polarella glacialis TaxID=89957 RepID=A0A813D065_POLGL|nr:unnamed protein product [Polarella glacialis]CAE8593429.1 unnamed protein product [Polarella glacialis]